MADAAEELTGFARSLRYSAPSVPMILNADARPARPDQDWAALMGAHLVTPVRWRDTQTRLAGEGVHSLVELGAGTTLGSLARRTVPHLRTASVDRPDAAALPAPA